MDAALAGILGAVVGACGGAVAAGITGFLARSQTKLQLAAQERQAERQIRADLATQLREPRRQAYATYAAEVSARLEALWWVSDAMSSAPPRREVALERLRGIDLTSSTAYEQVILEGPEEVALAAADLAAALAEMTHIAVSWLQDEAGVQPEERDFADELRRAHDAANSARRNFRLIAMDTVRADGRHPESEQAQLRTTAIGAWRQREPGS
ncbi:hypothetical protein ACFY3J_37030 [Streptomyces sp. NPDC001231]|uniref:hypothetical protein n=1 Tax=Streptomyces sp. NPDC001231 TaxID=3364549 RepID=UPI0036CCECF9